MNPVTKSILYLIAWIIVAAGCSSPNVAITALPQVHITALPLTSTPELSPLPTSIEVKRIVSDGVNAAIWSQDGKAIFYLVTRNDGSTPCCTREWMRLDLQLMQTEKATSIQGNTKDSITLAWLGEVAGQQISPDGSWVLYQRTPEGYVRPNPLPPMYRAPLELWLARIDGREPIRLWDWKEDCSEHLWQVDWLPNNQGAIVTCGIESTFRRIVVSVGGSKSQTFETWVGTPDKQSQLKYFGLPAYVVQISPDNSRVAFNEGNGELWLGFPGSQTEPYKVASLGFWPQWSLDSQRLYFLSINRPSPIEVPEVVAYNLADKTRTVIVNKEVLSKTDERFIVGSGEWKFSPAGNDLLVRIEGELWLIRWR